MNAAEANVFLTRAAQLDPRMKRVDPEDQADLAEMWAQAIPEVSLADAVSVIPLHYRVSREPMMPADVLRLLPVVDVPFVDGRDAWLLSQNIDPEDFDRLCARGVPVAVVLARFGVAVEGIES